MKTRDFAPYLCAVALATLSVPLWAHHGTAGNYDQTKVVKVQGTVKEFWWRNPHSALFIDGKDAAGNPVQYVLELGAPKALVNRGFTREMFKPGDTVDVNMHPSFAAPTNGEMMEEQFMVNGKQLRAVATSE